jgi:hypothetical protein
MPLSSISDKGSAASLPILDGTQLTGVEMPVETNSTSAHQQQVRQYGVPSSQVPPLVDTLIPPRSRGLNISARTSRTQSADFSSISSNTNSYTNTGSPVSPAHPKEFLGPDGVVMRSNLNGSWTRKPRQGSVRKHVMSFMEYDTENESLCSSRRSSLRAPGKAYLPAEQGRGLDQQESSLRR